MPKTLSVADDLSLPLDTVVQRKAIIAKNRAGKSNTGCVYVEEVHRHGVQTIVIDPKGDWYGIRSSADGKGPGLEFLVMGGEYGDVPLEPSAGKALGTYFGAHHVNVILDVSDFSKGELARFGADFLEALYDARKKNRQPLDLVLEEAEDFAPQFIEKWAGPDLPRCLGAVIKIAKKAGFLGIGLMLIAQRTASLNKNVLSQCDMLFLQRTTAPQDIKAVDAWLQDQDEEKRKEVLTHIQALPTGTAYVWAPEAGIFKKVQIRRRTTFDAGFTPKVGETKPEPKVKAMVDLTKLVGEMQVIVEQAKADDPKVLKAKIRDLEAKLAKQETRVEEKVVEKVVKVSVLTDEDRALLERVTKAGEEEVRDLLDDYEKVNAVVLRLQETLTVPPTAPVVMRRPTSIAVEPWPKGRPVAFKDSQMAKQILVDQERDDGVEEGDSDSPRKLTGGARRMLTVMCQYPRVPFDRETLGILGDMKAGTGGFNTALSFLRTSGYLREDGNFITASTEGRKAVGKVPPPATAADVREMWRRKYTGGARRMFEHLERIYPNRCNREELGQAAQMVAGTGGFNTALSALRTKHLLDEERDGIRLNPTLFLEGIGG